MPRASPYALYSVFQNVTYAEVEIKATSVHRPPRVQTEEVQYATLCHNAIADPLPGPSDHNAGELA